MPNRERGGAVSVWFTRTGGKVLKRGAQLGVAQPGQPLACGVTHRQRDEALFKVPLVHPQVNINHGFDGSPTVRFQNASFAQVICQRPALVACPGLEGGNELRLVDEPDLKSDQTEEQMAFGIGSHGITP
jgi:hypothetical protein